MRAKKEKFKGKLRTYLCIDEGNRLVVFGWDSEFAHLDVHFRRLKLHLIASYNAKKSKKIYEKYWKIWTLRYEETAASEENFL